MLTFSFNWGWSCFTEDYNLFFTVTNALCVWRHRKKLNKSSEWSVRPPWDSTCLLTFCFSKCVCSPFSRRIRKEEAMNFQSSRRRGEDGVAMVIDFLLSNARLVLGVGGAAMLGIATLVVKRVSVFWGRWYQWIMQDSLFLNRENKSIFGDTNYCKHLEP